MHVDDDGDPSVGSSPVPFEVLNRIGSSPDPCDDGDPTEDPSSEAMRKQRRSALFGARLPGAKRSSWRATTSRPAWFGGVR